MGFHTGKSRKYSTLGDKGLLGTISTPNAKRDLVRLKIITYIRACPKD